MKRHVGPINNQLMNFSYWFAKRLRLRHGAPASTATGAVIAVTGVALALMVMELCLAVTAGFKHEIERKVLGFDAPVSVLPAYDSNTATSDTELRCTDSLTAVIADAVPDAVQIPVFRRHSILKTDNDFMAVQCLARGAGHDESFERENMVSGSWPDFNSMAEADSIVISTVMAGKLGLNVGDKTLMYFFVDDRPKVRRAYICGIYKSNFGEYDNSIVYAPLDMMRRLGNDSVSATSIALEGIEKEHIDEVAGRLQNELLNAFSTGRLKQTYPVTDILTSGAVFFNWLDLLDTNVIVIFILMIAVAAFTLISSLFIIILDRVQAIGILRSLGATGHTVSRVFVFVALRLVGIGMIIGNALSLGIIVMQNVTHLLCLDPDMYYIDYVPFELNWTSVVLLNIGTAVVAWLILILPARIAVRVDPASTMRYE